MKTFFCCHGNGILVTCGIKGHNLLYHYVKVLKVDLSLFTTLVTLNIFLRNGYHDVATDVLTLATVNFCLK